jgi:hypothetical protein
MIERLGRQFFSTVRHVIGEVVRAGLIAMVAGFVLAEILGGVIDGRWPSRIFVHVIAVAFGLALGYAVAMSVAFFEGIKGVVATAGEIESELEGALRGAVDLGSHGVMGVVDAVEHRPHHQTPAAPQIAPSPVYPPTQPSQYPPSQYPPAQPSQYPPYPPTR